MSANPNLASRRRRNALQAESDFHSQFAPVCREFLVTGNGLVCEIYAAGKEKTRIVAGSADGKAVTGAFSLAIETSMRPGRASEGTDRAPLWTEPGAAGDYAASGAAVAALGGPGVVVDGPWNRIRVTCSGYTVSTANLAVWVL